MIHRWEQLTFLHWAFDVATVQALLPPGLTVDSYDGCAWVGLVPFNMWVAPPHLPALPWLGRFCETNVRTYVVDEHGRDGVWFFSLEAARAPAVIGGRVGYRLPYFWAGMSLDRVGDLVTYRSRRRIPGPKGATADADVRIGTPIDPADVTPFEHFLTARFRLFSVSHRDALRSADAEHERWSLCRASVERLDETVIAAAGLPQPVGEPIVHYSEGVEVRIGMPSRVGGSWCVSEPHD